MANAIVILMVSVSFMGQHMAFGRCFGTEIRIRSIEIGRTGRAVLVSVPSGSKSTDGKGNGIMP